MTNAMRDMLWDYATTMRRLALAGEPLPDRIVVSISAAPVSVLVDSGERLEGRVLVWNLYRGEELLSSADAVIVPALPNVKTLRDDVDWNLGRGALRVEIDDEWERATCPMAKVCSGFWGLSAPEPVNWKN